MWWQMAGRRGAFLFSFLPSFPRLRLLAAGGPPREDSSTFGRNVERRRRAARLLLARWGCSSGCSRLQRRRAASSLLHSLTTTPPRLRESLFAPGESARFLRSGAGAGAGTVAFQWKGAVACVRSSPAGGPPRSLPSPRFLRAHREKPLPFFASICFAPAGRDQGGRMGRGKESPDFSRVGARSRPGPAPGGGRTAAQSPVRPRGHFPTPKPKSSKQTETWERRPAPLLLLLLFEG